MRGVLALAATTLFLFAFGASPAVSDTGLQNVALSCSDGTNLGLTLSAADVTSLTDATTAMSLYPAGLSCGVSTQADPPPGGNPKQDAAVGGGNQFTFPTPCKINFGFTSHTPDEIPGGARGSFNETVPGGCASLGFTGQLRVDIDCLDVDGSHADMHGTVKKATGSFAEDGFGQNGNYNAYISTTDGGNFDTLGVKPSSNSPSSSVCGSTNEAIVSHGNVHVHDADAP